MPRGFERLNERSQRPNPLINFIKPLTSSSLQDQKIAQDFLERIAAQCYPVMTKEYISIMALEEFPPNQEFLGRNFNAGECIQLVLKDKAGRWLSFKFVQMVMMHELAHCKQMNHSRAFWQVRNQYADQMKELWNKRYQGEGLWGRGQDLTNGQFVHDRMPDTADIPEHLCGGTYRRARGKKRKRGQDADDKPKLSYAERQQKRIAKKFGVHGEGQGLGEDELVRGALEKGKRSYAKPRVANSKRGRELRAKAALARFDAMKAQQTPEKTPELEEDDGSETEDTDDEFGDSMAILDTLGKITDQQGRDLYRVCGDEEEQQDGGQKEMDELRLMGGGDDMGSREGEASPATKSAPEVHEDSETESEPENDICPPNLSATGPEQRDDSATAREADQYPNRAAIQSSPTNGSGGESKLQPTASINDSSMKSASDASACPICSLENEPDSPTCMACSHVLKTSLMPNHWRCKSESCKGSKYVNAGDAGRCGLCGAQRPVVPSRPMGVTGPDTLRWD